MRQVKVAFLEQKVVKMCGFRNPCPKCNPNHRSPSWLNTQKFSHEGFFTVHCTVWCLAVSEGARLAAGQTSARPMGVDFPLKNKVLWTTFSRTTGPAVPSSCKGSMPGGRPELRPAEGVDFSLKNKVEGLSPSTPRMV